MRILSVDWDFFFPELSFDPKLWMLYDWGHRDGGSMFLQELWYNRATGFVMNKLPLPMTTGEEKSFWSRFEFKPGAKLFYADSHVHIYSPEMQALILNDEKMTTIDNFDAHHDAGYRGTKEAMILSAEVTCEDWALAYNINGVRTRTFYPRWKTWAMKAERRPIYKLKRAFDDPNLKMKPYDHVYVCRSGGWTPPWLDEAFSEFLSACPIEEQRELRECKPRGWDPDRLQKQVEMYESVHSKI
jgi:hypothetical protein